MIADRRTMQQRSDGAAEPAGGQWQQGQTDVVTLLRSYFHTELAAIGMEDIDWPSWQPFFIQGRSPRAAIERALERDL